MAVEPTTQQNVLIFWAPVGNFCLSLSHIAESYLQCFYCLWPQQLATGQ